MLELTILGSSAAAPLVNRFQTSQVLDTPQSRFIIDCGEGMQIQMQKFQVKTSRIKAVFISHLHADHHLGLLGLLSTMHLHKREEDLHLFAPKGIDEIVRLILKLSQTQLSYKLIFEPIPYKAQEMIYDDGYLSVETLQMKHSLPCVGFLFKEKPKKPKVLIENLPADTPLEHILTLKNSESVLDEQGNILYDWQVYTQPSISYSFAHCADTQYTEGFLDQIQGVDLMYHEATFLQADIQKAIETYHSTAWQAATLAQKAGVKKLIIGHFSNRYKDVEVLLQEAQSVFSNTFLGVDGSKFLA